ncbi:hypothetical protein [Pseudomonas oryzihabitans]|uniref:hypothetical protein n=1 Tax=Pseudomonas oryzihabitans TaxID=47885 RepID=UPI002894B854|nr:hypothetical protein [Pseudomonas oryzihabitans]MDT3723069.1 hypothetical protein [Pseudomonas oryzihabitans]
MGISPVNGLQLLMICLLVCGAVGGWPDLSLVAAGLAVLGCLLQWGQLLKLARLFCVGAVLMAVLVAIKFPDKLDSLARSLEQGAAFAALMMVLGMLRHPVRRSPFVREAARYLLVYPPSTRYTATNVGAHFLSLLFNVGVITMIGDLSKHLGSSKAPNGSASNAMVVAAMRGAVLVSIWSPIGLGFAIVTTGIPTLEPLRFLLAALGFTTLAILITAKWPMLPLAAKVPFYREPPVSAPTKGPLIGTLAICVLLLLIVMGIHRWLDISFTLASVAVVPLLALGWLILEEAGEPTSLRQEVCSTIDGLSNLRSESAMFMGANVLGAGLSMLVQTLPGWQSLAVGDIPILPALLLCLVVIPLVAACCIPNSIVVVMAAQLLGNSPLGQHYPMALALTLAVAWAVAISISPISAMNLITGSLCGVSSRRAALVWNRPFAVTLTLLASVLIALVVLAEF